tara:strand:+ start:285 stop:437 length:153 start_codon:yes stop_codon:yes gene_type:complete
MRLRLRLGVRVRVRVRSGELLPVGVGVERGEGGEGSLTRGDALEQVRVRG